jgi:hypothetical protein
MRSVTGFLIVFLSATTALADPRVIVYNTFNPDGKTVVHVAFIVDEIRASRVFLFGNSEHCITHVAS